MTENRQKTMTSSKEMTVRLVFSALMIALGTVLSLISIDLPFGGSVTVASMVPMIIVAQLYGFKWGILSCTAFGLVQMILGLNNLSYAVSIWAAAAIILFDYIIAFGCISLAGLTRKMKNKAISAALGAFIACLIRYLCHVISGAVVWNTWADIVYVPDFLHNTVLVTNQNLFFWTYSVCYNATYMIPETILTMVVAAIIIGTVKFDKLLRR